MGKRQNIKGLKPELLGGFRDFLPDVMIYRQEVLDGIRRTFESFGFLPLNTPGLERSSVLGTDLDTFRMEVYRFSDDFGKRGQDVTLRFDLTVPLSRVVAAYPAILKPFKRYQCGPVWRKEKPQAGRFREFYQFDADIVGSGSILSDAEIVVLMYETLRNLGLDGFLIRINDRKILNGLPYAAGFDLQKAPDVLRVLDKLDKIGQGEVLKELARQSDNPFDESSIGLSAKSVKKIWDFLSLSDAGNLIGDLKKFFSGVAVAEEGIKECESILKILSSLGIPEKNIKLDLSVARGLGYYTGPVFETTLLDIPEIGSVFSGGRYDDLVMRFTGERMPCVGASVGVDRLIAALEKLGKINKRFSTAQVMFANFDPESVSSILLLSQKLRALGVKNEVYLGESDLRGQIIHAAKRSIPFVAILGEEERRAKTIKLKDMSRREEYVLTEEELFAKLFKE